MPLIPKKSIINKIHICADNVVVNKKTRPGTYMPNLHSHTGAGSIGDGFGKCDMWLDSLERRGLNVHAVTDHGTLAAIPQFYTEGKKRGIRIIAGMEGYVIPEYDGYRVDSDGNKTTDIGNGTKIVRHRFRHVVLLAMNEIGWKNLIKINNIAWRQGYFRGRGRFDYKTLFDNSEGLICSSACIAGILSFPFTDFFYGDKEEFTTIEEAREDAEMRVKQFVRVFGDRFYVELMMFKAEVQKFVNKELYRLVKKYDLQPLITNDCHYPEPELHKYREMLREFRYKSTSSDISRENDADNAGKDFELPDLHPRSIEEIKHSWRDGGHGGFIPWDVIADGISNTIRIADRCKFELDTSLKLPKFDVKAHPAWKRASRDDVATATVSENEKLFMHLVKAGYEKEMGKKWPNNTWKNLLDGKKDVSDVKDSYLKSVFVEYKVIRDANFIDYFLIVQDIVRYCMDECGRLYGQGRGSVAGSVISWFLGISRDDPLEHGLYFERFMNPGRVKGELPDIDMDFPPGIRENIKEYISRKYGQDNVSSIGTISEIKIKSALQKVAAAHDFKIDGEVYDFRQIQIITHSIPGQIGGGVKIEELEDAVAVCNRLEDNLFSAFYIKHKDWIDNNVNLMVNHPHTYGRHAAGVIISPKNVDECIPIRMAESGGKMIAVSQWRDKDLLPLGFLKMDILGLRTLEEIEFAWKLVKRRHDIVLPSISKVDTNDQEVYRKIFRLGRTTGIFQLNSAVFQKYLKELKPRNYTNVYTTTALLRPGPMSSDMHKLYIKLQHGMVRASYLHSSMKNALESTGGIAVFQEQVMKLAVDMAGFTLEEADNMRSIIGKKKRDKMPLEREKFINGCIKNKIKRSIAENVFNQIEGWMGYGFNKSHAVAYTGISFYQAWLKTHYPVEFWASKLQSAETNVEDKESVWALRATAMEEGIKFGEFSVNTCGHEIRIDKESKIYWRLDFVKGVGTGAAALIKKCAPYVNVEDLVDKTTKYFKKLKSEAIKAGQKITGNCPVGKSAIMALIAAGALDPVYDNPNRYQIAAEYLKKYYGKKWELISGFVVSGISKDAKLTAAQAKDITFLRMMSASYKMIAMQHEVLRFSPRPYWKIFKDVKPDTKPGVTASMLQRMTTGALVHTYGLLTSFEIKKYKGGKMIVGAVNEYDGPIRFVMFNDDFIKHKNELTKIVENSFVCVIGNVKDDSYRGGKQIFATNITYINPEDEDVAF
jgi:DNA polymerase III subunit alpha